MNSENKNESAINVTINGTGNESNAVKCKDTITKCNWKNKSEVRAYIKMYRENNKEKIKLQNKESYLKYKEKNNKRSRKYYYNNKEKIKLLRTDYLLKNKLKIQTARKKYELENKEKIKAYKKNKRETDPNYKLQCNLRRRIKRLLKNKIKVGSAIRDLGCSVNELKLYLENKFKPGMTWKNHGPIGWHLDHIIPLSFFNLEDREQFLKACHYTNLQPLWAKDNLSKGNKITPFTGGIPTDVLRS